jgi:uncharacterized tellurite resistance protein B-like protein
MLAPLVALYLLVLLVASLPLAFAGVALYGLVRWLRARTLRRRELHVHPREARPGDTIHVRARVEAGGGRPILVEATLTCTLFDHRPRKLVARTVLLSAAPGSDELVGELVVPRGALRTGAVGDGLSTLFSEEARRLLAFWTVCFEVRAADARRTLIWRHSLPVEIVEGRALSTDDRFVSQMVCDTFGALRDDLVFNWLVQMAARDGDVSKAEREFLHECLKSAHGVTDAAEADRRITAELQKKMTLDPELMRRHVPVAQRVDLYKLLFAMAWRDGTLDEREHAFLLETLRGFGLDHHHVREVELEVLRGIAAASLG